jgi:hypothetical protein
MRLFFWGGGMLSCGGRFVDGTFQRVGCFEEGRFVAVHFCGRRFQEGRSVLILSLKNKQINL